MTDKREEILLKLADAKQAGVDMRSPKALVTYLLGLGDKEAILYFYKPGSVEFDFEKYAAAVEEMQESEK